MRRPLSAALTVARRSHVTPLLTGPQVQKIRGELRNRKLAGVTVERLLNVQGRCGTARPAHAREHTCTQTHTHTHADRSTHPRTCARAHMHTYTHIHTYAHCTGVQSCKHSLISCVCSSRACFCLQKKSCFSSCVRIIWTLLKKLASD